MKSVRQIKETDDDTNKWKDIPCSWIRKILLKMPKLHKAIQRFNVIPIKILITRFQGYSVSVNLYGKIKILNSQSNLQKEQSWRNHTPRFQTILQSYSNQNSIVLEQKQTNRSVKQNREPRSELTIN